MYTSRDFASDTPPERIMGTEMEYSFSVRDKTTRLSQDVAQRIRKMHGVVGEGQFLPNGARVYADMSNVEYATPECSGPLEQACAEMAGETIVKATVQAMGIPHDMYRRTGGAGVDGLQSVGFHQNLLTPRYKEESLQIRDAHVMGSYLTTRAIWAGVGRLTNKGMHFGQKAHDINRRTSTGPDETNVLNIGTLAYRTVATQKPILTWSRQNGSGTMESHARKYERLEIRYADAAHSPWLRFMGMATASLVLRVAEHKDMYSDDFWPNVTLKKIAHSTLEVSSDTSLSKQYELQSGKRITAIQLQQRLAEAALYLAEKVHLPSDELDAANQWYELCDELSATSFSDHDDVARLSDRLEWAARLYTIRRRNLLTGNTLNVGRQNLEAASIDLMWDRIYPTSIAEKYWRRQQPSFYADNDAEVSRLISHPPKRTRAALRGHAIREKHFAPGNRWDVLETHAKVRYDISDPYMTAL